MSAIVQHTVTEWVLMVEADTSGRAVNLGLYLILLKIAHFGLICQYHPEVPAQRLSEARCLALPGPGSRTRWDPDGRASRGSFGWSFLSGVPLFHNGPAGLVGDLVTARIRSRVVSQSQ